jgi:hypothetical protein
MDHNETAIPDHRPTTNNYEDKNQARRERDRARQNSLTGQQKEEINAHRRAQRRAKLNSLTADEKEEINEHRRATR